MNPLQAHSANKTFDIHMNLLLRKELAKIEFSNVNQFLPAHLQLEIRKLQMSLQDV
jgi:hypothetical protein